MEMVFFFYTDVWKLKIEKNHLSSEMKSETYV